MIRRLESNKEKILSTIKVNVSLYGSLAKRANKLHVAQFDVHVKPGDTKKELMEQLGIQDAERGYLFINAVLYDVPGLVSETTDELKEGDHIGIFSIDYMWPYQYRDGVRMSEGLQDLLGEHGAMHHTY